MKPTFLNHERPLLTVMLQCETPETAIGRIRNANCLGADAYGLQVESLKPEYHNEETYKRIFAEMKGRPSYVTNYRSAKNTGKTDEEIALDEDIEIDIMRLEDEEGNVLFPIYTDDDELEKLAEEEDFDVFGLVVSAEDLATLLYENEGDEFDGVVINPFHENAIELPLEAIFELYEVDVCDDPY